MSSFVVPQPATVSPSLRSRSIGVKFFLIILLALGMSLPAIYVDDLVDQRAASHQAAATSPNQPVRTVWGIPLADSYRSVTRSLKYVTLFLGLVFLTFFLFEISAGKRLHPGQYALVGLAQIIFYLLLLSLAELVGFDLAFLVAGSATVLLFSFNAQWVFGSATQRWRAMGVFTLLYAFIYVLLRLQNYALLVGASASFGAIALAMYFTRNIDWYGGQQTVPTGAPAPSPRSSWLD